MAILFYILISIGISSILVSFLILGEFLTSKFPNSKFAKFWRKRIVSEDNDHP